MVGTPGFKLRVSLAVSGKITQVSKLLTTLGMHNPILAGHLNDLEDLFLDQRSDSGILVQTTAPASASEAPAFRAIRLVPDVPCLACFTRDFVCAPTAPFLFVAELGPLPLFPPSPDVATPALVLADAASRAPPRGS